MTKQTRCSSRPWRLIALTAALTLMQIGAMVRAVSMPDNLADRVSLFVPLEFAAASLWALIFAWVTVNLIRTRAIPPARWVLAGFGIYSTVRLLVFAQADYDQNRLPFLLVVTLLALFVIFFLRR